VKSAGRVRLAVAAVLVVLLSPLARLAAQPAPILIKELTIEGNRRVQEAVILARVKSAVGSAFNPSLLSEDLRAIFGLGFFDDVQMKVEDFEGGVKVTFVVVERPFVRDLDFVGNTRASASDLQEKIDLKLGGVYNPVDIQRAREKLKDYYEDEGYFEVQITPSVEKFADGDVRVVFTINEGRRMTIDKIVIRGHKGLSEREIKKALATKERQYFILRGTVQRQRLEEDVERILAVYGDHGFIQARVEDKEVAVDRERARVTITFTVVEGPQYRVGEIVLAGATLFPETELRRQLTFKAGDVFSRSELRDSLRRIADLYSTIGRASAEITPKTEQTAERVDVTLDIAEGPEVYVERINISGNVRSQDKVLRREIPLIEGELFTLQKLQRARQRLVNLGYFETVNATTHPGSDKTKIVVDVDVTERPTGLFSIGGGFSSVDSFVGTLDLSQRNFLGRGWEASVRLRLGERSQQGILSFTEPWLFDRPLAAGVDLFSTRRQFTEYDYDTLGGGVRFSHPFAEFWRWNTGYRLTRDKISGVTDSSATLLRDEVGTRVTSLVSGGVSRDSRDSVVAPTKGGQSSVTLDVAGLGGDSRYVKTIASTTYFKPIWLGHVLSARAEAGYGFGWGGEEVPVFERFYLGGPNSIRGVKFRRISPTDETGLRIGGTSELLGNLEYIVPLPFNLRVAGFFDIGNAYGFGTKFDPTNTREAAGGGVRWLSPFGPIRVDYGILLDRRKGEDFGALHFSVGSPF
jgi:outer membrane protein insertion porin family